MVMSVALATGNSKLCLNLGTGIGTSLHGFYRGLGEWGDGKEGVYVLWFADVGWQVDKLGEAL